MRLRGALSYTSQSQKLRLTAILLSRINPQRLLLTITNGKIHSTDASKTYATQEDVTQINLPRNAGYSKILNSETNFDLIPKQIQHRSFLFN